MCKLLCPNCGRFLAKNGKTKTKKKGKTKPGNQRWSCRKAKGGCGYNLTDGGNTHGGVRVPRIYNSNADRQKAYRDRIKEEDNRSYD